MNNDEPELDSLNFIPKELLANQRARHAADRPAAPERDRWDEQAELELPCDCGDFLKQGLGFHRSSCRVFLRVTYAAGLRKAYSEGQDDMDKKWQRVADKNEGRAYSEGESDGYAAGLRDARERL